MTTDDIDRLDRAMSKLAYNPDHTVGRRHCRDGRSPQKQFPNIVGPHKKTSAMRLPIARRGQTRGPVVDAMIVVGAPNSSNSQRLKEVAERSPARRSCAARGRSQLGLFRRRCQDRRRGGRFGTGVLVEEILGASERFAIELETVTATGGVFFPLPRPLREHSRRSSA